METHHETECVEGLLESADRRKVRRIPDPGGSGMPRVRAGFTIVLFLSLLAGCGISERKATESVKSTPGITTASVDVSAVKQPAVPDMSFLAADVSRTFEPFRHLQGLRDVGITFFGAEKLFWNDFEAEASSGYDWEAYDAVIREVESIGGDILPTIWSVSTWATAVPSAEAPASAPRPDYRERYAGFVQAFMERYDHDGVEDMPGLLYVPKFLQIEDEAENLGDSWINGPACSAYKKDSDERFRCAADEYGEMLKLAYQAAHTANPDSKILSFSFNFGDFLDANPAVFPETPPFARNRLAFLDQVFLEYQEYFDVIALQCNYDYPGIPRSFDYIRNTYHLEKPILCADAASMPMIGLQQVHPGDRYEDLYPFLSDRRILEILGGGEADPKFGEVSSWWEAKKSSLSIKKAVVAADAGALQTGFQFVMTGWGGKNNVWTYAELLSAGPEYGEEEPAGTPRPVVYALGQLGERIADFHSVENLNPISPGTDPRNWLWVYRFSGREGFIYVVWSGAGERVANLSGYISGPTARITSIITSLDGDNQPVYPQEVVRSVDAIPVNETPIFIE